MFEHLQMLGSILARWMMSQLHGAYILAADNKYSTGKKEKKKASDFGVQFLQGGEKRPV